MLRRMERLDEECDVLREGESETLGGSSPGATQEASDPLGATSAGGAQDRPAKRQRKTAAEVQRPYARRDATSPITLFLSLWWHFLRFAGRNPHSGIRMDLDEFSATGKGRRNFLAQSPFAHQVHNVQCYTGWSTPKPTSLAEFSPAAINFIPELVFMNNLRGSVSGAKLASLLARMTRGGLAVAAAVDGMQLTAEESEKIEAIYLAGSDGTWPENLPRWRHGRLTGMNLNRLDKAERCHFPASALRLVKKETTMARRFDHLW
ncbi:hypothetical protein V8E36_007788 [Tilletia maclaganii]